MAGTGEPTGREPAKPIDLAAALRRVRERQADRGDVVVEMAHAARARLELLAQDLEPLVADLPGESELFDFELSAGETPRLWIDAVSHVRMGRDRRVYEFVKDTRNGRIVIASSEDRRKIGQQIADYVAERILERQRVMEGDWPASTQRTSRNLLAPVAARRWLVMLLHVGLGAVGGAAAMFLWAWLAA